MKKIIQILSFILLISNCAVEETEPENEVKSVPVRVLKVQTQKRQELINLTGTVAIDREMKIGFKLGGKIISFTCDEGKYVRKGDVLAELDTNELRARLEKALEYRDKVKRDLERMEKLFRGKAASESSLQDARTAVKSADAEIKILRDNLENSRIEVPFSGKILKKLVEEGEIVGTGTPIAILADMDPILIKAAISDHLIPKMKPGKPVLVNIDSAPDKSFNGKIYRICSTADPVTRTLDIEFRVPNPREIFKPGLLANVQIPFQENDPRIFIPLDSIIGFGAHPFVYIVKDSMAEKKEVKTGRLIKDEVEILEGLNTGDIVVISGQEYLRDKKPVLIETHGEIIR